MLGKYDYFDASCACGDPFMARGQSAEDMVAELGSYGIRRGVVRFNEQMYYNPQDAQTFVYEKMKKLAPLGYKGLLTVVPSVTGEMAPAEETLAHFPEFLAGITMTLDWYNIPRHPLFLEDWFSAAEKHRVPVWFRAENMDDICYVADILEHFPKLNMVLSVKEMWPNGRKILPIVLKYKGVHITLADYYWLGGIENFVEKVGAEQLVFSTDHPRKLPGAAMMMLAQADITEEQKDLIAHKNLERLIGGVVRD